MLFTQLSECHHKWYFNALLYIGQWGGKREEAKEDVQIWEVQIHCIHNGSGWFDFVLGYFAEAHNRSMSYYYLYTLYLYDN